MNINSLCSFDLITKEVMEAVIKDTKNKYSAVDDIPAELINLILNTISDDLLDIINNSLQTGNFPSCLKRSRIYNSYY